MSGETTSTTTTTTTTTTSTSTTTAEVDEKELVADEKNNTESNTYKIDSNCTPKCKTCIFKQYWFIVVIITFLIVALGIAICCYVSSEIIVSDQSIVLLFVGILATFIVVGNYFQVKEIEGKMDKKAEELKSKTIELNIMIKERDGLIKEQKEAIEEQKNKFEIENKNNIGLIFHSHAVTQFVVSRFDNALFFILKAIEMYVEFNNVKTKKCINLCLDIINNNADNIDFGATKINTLSNIINQSINANNTYIIIEMFEKLSEKKDLFNYEDENTKEQFISIVEKGMQLKKSE